MPDRISAVRENPGIRNASWNRQRSGVQDVQEIAGAKEWKPPRMQRDDSRDGTGLDPLPVVERTPMTTMERAEVVQQLGPVLSDPLPVQDAHLEQYRPRRTPGNPVIEFPFCILCGTSDKDALLIDAREEDTIALGHDGHRVCDRCVERLMDRLRAAIPKRRLRLALERMMQGEVTEAMVAEVERLTGGKSG